MKEFRGYGKSPCGAPKRSSRHGSPPVTNVGDVNSDCKNVIPTVGIEPGTIGKKRTCSSLMDVLSHRLRAEEKGEKRQKRNSYTEESR